MDRIRPYTALLGLVILLFYGGFLVSWLAGFHRFNLAWTDLWGVYLVMRVEPGAPPVPFFDLYGVLSWRDCYVFGIDVMAANPCDMAGRLSNYSPLWYLLPTGGRDLYIPWALLMNGLFLAALPPLLRPSSRGELALAALAAISFATLFAVERANIDIIMFLMTLAALFFWRGGQGGKAYGVMLAAALLKFYPLALLAMAAREPVRRFWIVTAACGLVVVSFIAIFWSELARLPALMPADIYFGNMFGAGIFGLGVTQEMALDPMVRPLLTLLLLGLCLWGAWRVAARLGPVLEDAFWTSREGAALLAGALVMVGCFFLSSNVGYRAIFLLLALPGFFVLRRMQETARLAGWALAATLVCLYSEPLRRLSQALRNLLFAPDQPGNLADNIPEVIFFLLREACWWGLAALLSGVILVFLRRAPLFAALARRRR